MLLTVPCLWCVLCSWRILDYLSHFPESANILTWLLDDNGIPANWRVLEGYGVNTYVLINKDGKETYVKFHFRPRDGAYQCALGVLP